MTRPVYGELYSTRVPFSFEPDFSGHLDKLGAEGWELVIILETSKGSYTGYFKRQVNDVKQSK